jgi:glycerol transport system substrate-binding protein
MVADDLAVVNEDGTPKWRMAPSPHGAYWQEGMKVGYQDAGSVTLLESTPVDRSQAAWLYGQFIASKTVDLAKSHYGLTFVRESTIQHDSFTERAPRLGGLIEFYRSPERDLWTDTGFNVPDYPRLAQLWWQNIGDAASRLRSAQDVMDSLCDQQDAIMARIERSGVQGDVGPRLNEMQDDEYWLSQPGAPWPKLDDEKGEPITIAYDELIRRWTE